MICPFCHCVWSGTVEQMTERVTWEAAARRCEEAASQPHVAYDTCKELARQFRARAAAQGVTP